VANAFHAETWIAAFTYDPPAYTWSEGEHGYSFEHSYSVPEPGGGGVSDHLYTFSVSSLPPESGGPPLYDGYVLLRPGALRALTDGECATIDSIRPDQPTRFLWGWITDFDMTREQAQAHFDSLTARARWDESGSAELVRHEIFASNEVDWPSYVCSYTLLPSE
jgi:hypothetical protein